MPNGLAVMGLSAFGYVAALLPKVPPKLAGDAMLPALEGPVMPGKGELLVLVPAMPSGGLQRCGSLKL